MEKITEVFVVLENKPGALGALTRVFKKKRIAIYAIGVFQDTARLHVSDPDKALEALSEHGYEAELRQVLRVALPNRMGALWELTQKLGNAGINIEYLYGTMQEKQKRGMIIFEVDQPDLALQLFRNEAF